MPRQFISKELLLKEAYRIAEEDGLSNLSVRKLAAACKMSVGSLYSYFPTKADLTVAVVNQLYANAFFDELCAIRKGERFVSYLRRLQSSMTHVMENYATNWMSEVYKLSYQEREACKQAEFNLFNHVKKGLVCVLDNDAFLDRSKLVGPLEAEPLCSFVLDEIIKGSSERRSSDTLFALLEHTLYS